MFQRSQKSWRLFKFFTGQDEGYTFIVGGIVNPGACLTPGQKVQVQICVSFTSQAFIVFHNYSYLFIIIR